MESVIQEWEGQASPCPGPLLVFTWGLSAGGSDLGSLGSTHPLCLPRVESARFPQPTMADFRMTFPEAEVNQPLQPPLSIFSLGGRERTQVLLSSALHRCLLPHAGMGRPLGIRLLPQPEAFHV